MTTAIEIRIRTQRNGARMAFYRTANGASRFWHQLPVRQAEQALRSGRISVGLAENVPALAA